MKLAFLAPAGAMHRHNGSFGKSLHYAPLTLTTLAALVPEELDARCVIHDETAGKIPLGLDADLICITGTAPRCYAYADHYRRRGYTVVLGGVHPTLMPEEAARHAGAVMTGFSEQTFPQMLRDFRRGELKTRYGQNYDYTIDGRPIPRRKLLNVKRYITTCTVEAVRGCSLPCTFCAYPAAFGKTVYMRPVREVIAEIEALDSRHVLFPDVNLIADRSYALELFRAMSPPRKIWLGLATSQVGIDDELIDIFARNGCKGLLIGFESLSPDNLAQMNKSWETALEERDELVRRIHGAGIGIYATFVFGYDSDDERSFEHTMEFAQKHRFYTAAFNHLLPYPGTATYRELREQGRLLSEQWWLEPDYNYGELAFFPKQMSPEKMSLFCKQARDEFSNLPTVIGRGTAAMGRSSPLMWSLFWAMNLRLGREVDEKMNVPIGEKLDELPK